MDLPVNVNQWRQRESAERTKLQELAWLGIDDGPPTCTSSVAINVGSFRPSDRGLFC